MPRNGDSPSGQMTNRSNEVSVDMSHAQNVDNDAPLSAKDRVVAALSDIPGLFRRALSYARQSLWNYTALFTCVLPQSKARLTRKDLCHTLPLSTFILWVWVFIFLIIECSGGAGGTSPGAVLRIVMIFFIFLLFLLPGSFLLSRAATLEQTTPLESASGLASSFFLVSFLVLTAAISSSWGAFGLSDRAAPMPVFTMGNSSLADGFTNMQNSVSTVLDAQHAGRSAKTFFEIMFYMLFGMPVVSASFQAAIMYQVERIQQLQQSQGGGDVSGHAESSDDSSHDVVGGLPFAVSTPVPQREQPWTQRQIVGASPNTLEPSPKQAPGPLVIGRDGGYPMSVSMESIPLSQDGRDSPAPSKKPPAKPNTTVAKGGELPKPAAANLRSKTTEVGNSRAGAKKPVGGGDETASNPKTGDYSDEDDWDEDEVSGECEPPPTRAPVEKPKPTPAPVEKPKPTPAPAPKEAPASGKKKKKGKAAKTDDDTFDQV